jgi:hypothetical protein
LRGGSHKVNAAPALHSGNSLLDYLSGLLMPKFGLGWMVTATAVLLLCGFWLTGRITGLRQTLRQTEADRLALHQREEELRGTASRQRAETLAKRDEANSLSELVASGANTLSASLGRPTPTATPALKLSLATARNANQPAELKLSSAAQTTLMSLTLEPSLPPATRYQVKLRAVETTSPTWQWDSAPQNGQLLIELPAQDLAAGLYSLTVNRLADAVASEFAGEVFLRVVRP